MTYRGYYGSIDFSEEDELFYGKIEFIRGLVNYESKDAKGIKQAFYKAVDDYLAYCNVKNIEPERSFKGSFNVRVGEMLHHKAAIFARQQNISINDLVKQALVLYTNTAQQ